MDPSAVTYCTVVIRPFKQHKRMAQKHLPIGHCPTLLYHSIVVKALLMTNKRCDL